MRMQTQLSPVAVVFVCKTLYVAMVCSTYVPDKDGKGERKKKSLLDKRARTDPT